MTVTPRPFWSERLAARVMTAKQAVRLIHPGRRILIGSGAAEPVTLVRALVEDAPHLQDNELVHLLTLGPAPYVDPGQERRFRHCAFFIGQNVRDAVCDGRADFMPVFLSEIPQLIRSRRVKIDVALIQVSPPDVHGYCSLGVSVDVVRAAVESADLVLAEVNPRMPRTHGDSFLHQSRIHALVPVDAPLLERKAEAPDQVSLDIGRHIASLVPDGATLQMGIGKIPDSVLAALANHHDLGVHTEMMSDGVMQLVEAGVITGRRKTLLTGKHVTSFIMGTERLYRWADDNPAIEMRSSDFTNDPFVIAQNEQMMAINGALEVDLTGQVAADTLDGRFFSGIGGQVDFIRGAARSKGGRPVIALPSTARRGAVSRIKPMLEEGTGVVTSRGDVHYVVTEYGVADLWGKSVRQRALALISIAHPDFRAELLAAAKGRHWVLPDQPVPRGRHPWAGKREELLPGGQKVIVRPAKLTDERALQDLLYKLSDETIYRRFLAHRRTHPREEVQELVDLDYEANMALVAAAADSGELIAIARYDVDPATNLADLAFLVRDDWQCKGLGSALMRRMTEIGRARGLKGFTLDVLATNRPMLSVIHRSGLKVESHADGDTYRMVASFPPGAPPDARTDGGGGS